MGENIITVKDLKKTYRINKRSNGLFGHIANLFVSKYEQKKAVDGISFDIKRGEVVGFIGANGAGKSTTIKILTGILYPDSGYVEVNNYIPYKDRKAYVANIGVVFGQKSQLSWDLPVIDTFELLKNIYKIPENVYEENVKLYTELLDMGSFINQPVRQLSLGQRMRADIAASLLHSPQIIFFDEPTIGLDVLAKEKIRDFIRYLKHEKNITMIFTTHDMQDIEQTCERLIVIDKGKKMYDGSVSDLLKKYGGSKTIIVEFGELIDTEFAFDHVTVKKEDKSNQVIFEFDSSKVDVDDIMRQILQYKVNDIAVKESDVESIVRKIYEGSIVLE